MDKRPQSYAGFLLSKCSLLVLCALFTRSSEATAQPSNELRIQSILRIGDAVELQWISETKSYYNVWFSDSLTNAHPRFVALNLPGTGDVLSWTDSGDSTSSPPRLSPVAQRFYRILKTKQKIDKFGIIMLYPGATNANAKSWYSTWDNLHERSFVSFESSDPYDPWFHTAHGGASYSTDGNGILSISPKVSSIIEKTPRMHIHDPAKANQWHHGVECTVYAMRVSDEGPPLGTNYAYAGIEIVARTNHEVDKDLCDCRGIGGRMRYDGDIDFEKETSHPHVKTIARPDRYWTNGMPYNVWIGCKFVVYDCPLDGNVKLELWIDETDGTNGGKWCKIHEFLDDGTNFGVGGTNCNTNIAGLFPQRKLIDEEDRLGSESGKPNLTIRFRSDGVNTNGLLYKKASVREITP